MVGVVEFCLIVFVAVAGIVVGRLPGCDLGSFLLMERFLRYGGRLLVAYIWLLKNGIGVTAGSLLVRFLIACKFTGCEARTFAISICSSSI